MLRKNQPSKEELFAIGQQLVNATLGEEVETIKTEIPEFYCQVTGTPKGYFLQIRSDDASVDQFISDYGKSNVEKYLGEVKDVHAHAKVFLESYIISYTRCQESFIVK